jgi:hypothetical protein
VISFIPCGAPVRIFYSRFHSRLAPGFTPDSRSNSIALHHTRSDKFTHSFNANIAHGLTPSHSIPISTDRPFKARTLWLEILFMPSEAYVKRESICL